MYHFWYDETWDRGTPLPPCWKFVPIWLILYEYPAGYHLSYRLTLGPMLRLLTLWNQCGGAHRASFVTEIREILTAASRCAAAVGRQLEMLGRAQHIFLKKVLQRNILPRNILSRYILQRNILQALAVKMLGRASQAVVGGLEDAFQWYGRQVTILDCQSSHAMAERTHVPRRSFFQQKLFSFPLGKP